MDSNRQKTFLRQWREYRGLSLEEAGEKIGVTHGHLSKIERGKRHYNQDQLEGLARVYGTSLVALLTVDPKNTEQRLKSEIQDLIDRMPPDLAARAVQMLKLLR
jgi:transcriptional regulator with XRE-family HTH domain